MGRTGRRAGNATNCLFLTTTDEALLRAAALARLWRGGFVEPVQAPPQPCHILAQQLMALCLQERGIGRSEWFGWLEAVPAFSRMDRAVVGTLVDFMLDSQILWSDGGILAFAPEGESKYGRKNFMDLLSVFTSPPLFQVTWGRKELGHVHESTFFKPDGGPSVLLLAGRCWKTNHLDWRRRIAHVEPTEQVGKSRWLGEGQFLCHRVCQAVRETLAGDEVDPHWSRRAVARIGEHFVGHLALHHEDLTFEEASHVGEPHQQRAGEIRQDVPEDDARLTGAGRLGGQTVIFFAQGQ